MQFFDVWIHYASDIQLTYNWLHVLHLTNQ